jgi:RimJ/RimL family protein N-acetyltransferase
MSPTAYRIHTPNLVVRCWEPADAPQLTAAKNASKEHLLPWMPWALGEPSDLAANLALIRAWHAQFDTDQDYVYGIFDRVNSTVVGGTGLHERIGKNAREIGYWVCAGAVNRGIATEASAALTKVGFEFMGLDRMEIHCDLRNVRSAAIPRKLGYVHEATLRRRAITVGAPSDSMIWTLFADEYPGSPAAQIAIEAFDALGNKLAPLARPETQP